MQAHGWEALAVFLVALHFIIFLIFTFRKRKINVWAPTQVILYTQCSFFFVVVVLR